ncbi:MAG: hypothetical protein LBT05_05565 [Planctomycetaceae bacterium]|nr:hypothetical protein [Planctomycetaceae bacterium]
MIPRTLFANFRIEPAFYQLRISVFAGNTSHRRERLRVPTPLSKAANPKTERSREPPRASR